MTRFSGRAPLLVAALLLVGCPAAPIKDPDAEVRSERSKLPTEDRALVEAQDYCATGGGRLGSMGPPVKVLIKGQPVFLCCAHCKEDAEADPDKTLAKVEELKAKAKPVGP